MEIINPLDSQNHDIKPRLRDLAASSDPLAALRGRFLLELVQYLEKNSGPRLGAGLFIQQLHLNAGRPRSAMVEVEVDWTDYGPLENGLPAAHYRIRLKRQDVPLSEECRTTNLEQARQFIVQAFADG